MQRVHLEYLGDSIELPIGETVIGRDLTCALRFNDPAVSRKHVRFIRRVKEVFVEDLQSSNGTLLNGRTLKAALRLADGDEVRVGSRLLKVRITEGPEEDVPSTLVLRGMNAGAGDEIKKPVRATTQIAVTVPPPLTTNQRCPRCAAAVNLEDDECANCKFRWADFRPQGRTDVRPNPLNRRRHDRQPIELSLVYSSSELEIEATSRDLSESGVFVCTEVLEPVGTECQITILVDGGPPVNVNGLVRRVVDRMTADGEPIGLGVEFVKVGATEMSWIKTAVTRLAEEPEERPTRPIDTSDL